MKNSCAVYINAEHNDLKTSIKIVQFREITLLVYLEYIRTAALIPNKYLFHYFSIFSPLCLLMQLCKFLIVISKSVFCVFISVGLVFWNQVFLAFRLNEFGNKNHLMEMNLVKNEYKFRSLWCGAIFSQYFRNQKLGFQVPNPSLICLHTGNLYKLAVLLI